jgi:hypothetical protein
VTGVDYMGCESSRVLVWLGYESCERNRLTGIGARGVPIIARMRGR